MRALSDQCSSRPQTPLFYSFEDLQVACQHLQWPHTQLVAEFAAEDPFHGLPDQIYQRTCCRSILFLLSMNH